MRRALVVMALFCAGCLDTANSSNPWDLNGVGANPIVVQAQVSGRGAAVSWSWTTTSLITPAPSTSAQCS